MITKKDLQNDMFALHLSRQEIAQKYSVSEEFIQYLQNKFKLQILNFAGEKMPRSLTEEQKQIILGSLFYSAKLIDKPGDQYCLRITHLVKNEDLLDFKFNSLAPLIRTKPTKQISKMGEKNALCKSFKTLGHDYLTFISEQIYSAQNKIPGETDLSAQDNNFSQGNNFAQDNIFGFILPRLNAFGLSVLFADCGVIRRYYADFAFEAFSKKEQEIFCSWIEDKFGIEARVIEFKKKFFRTRILRKSLGILLEALDEKIFVKSKKYLLKKGVRKNF